MPKKITKDAISGGMDMLIAQMTPKAEQPADEEKNLKKKTARAKKTAPQKAETLTKGQKYKVEIAEPKKSDPVTMEVEYTESTWPAEPTTVILTKKTEEPAPKKKSKAYTLWMDPDTIELLDVYCKTAKKKKVDIIRAAISEYTRRHKVTEEQKAAYQGRTDILG